MKTVAEESGAMPEASCAVDAAMELGAGSQDLGISALLL